MSLPSQFEVCKAQMCLKCDHLQFAFCWNDLTSGINRLNLNPNSQNWQKEKELTDPRMPPKEKTYGAVHFDGSLRTTRPHAKNGNPFKNNKRM
jgi:hypothetical protein